MELPRPLAPWASQLAIFPPDLAASLGPLVEALARIVGPLRAEKDGADGDPDGFDGVSRRGVYERLLASEWSLAEEAPEEFLRRAAMGEHSFLRLARPERAGSKLSVALFDAGPSQIGSPRLVQLAALIVLARRAETAGVRFAWGILQQPNGRLHTGVDPAMIEGLLRARTAQEPGETTLDAWRARVRHAELLETWLVGAPRLARLAGSQGAAHLEIDDPLEAAGRTVRAAVHRGARAGAQVVLDLPPDPVCARLVRHPFQPLPANTRPVEPQLAALSSLVFAPDGSRLFWRAPGGGIVILRVPASPGAPLPEPRLYRSRSHAPIVGVGWISGAPVLLCAPEGTLNFHAEGAEPWTDPPLGRAADPPALGQCLAVRGDAEEPEQLLALHPTKGALFEKVARGDRELWLPVAWNVAAMAPVGRRVSFITKEAAAERWRVSSRGPDEPKSTSFTVEGHGHGAFFGFGVEHANFRYGFLTLEKEQGRWTTLDARGWIIQTAPVGASVVGVARNRMREHEPGLLVLEDDRRRLSLVGQGWSRELALHVPGPIEAVTVSPATPLVACATSEGHVLGYSLEQDTPMFCISPEHTR